MFASSKVGAYLKAHPDEVEWLREELCLPLGPIAARCSLPEGHEYRDHAMGHALTDHLASAGLSAQAVALIDRRRPPRRKGGA